MIESWFELVGPQRAIQIFGIRLVGISVENAVKLGLTIILVLVIVVISRMLRRMVGRRTRSLENERIRFWTRQGISIGTAILILIAVLSVWFDDPTRLTTAMGLVTAGLAFALQRVITALAGYVVIMRGRTFSVGDRITMGGVRGDVIALGFLNTTIMEMGQPPSVQNADPAMWVRARQYTGRIVSVTNAKIFDEPVFNYSSHFPYIWEEISVPIAYKADRHRVESILLSVAERHAVKASEMTTEALAELQRRFFITQPDVAPRVFWRMTDNWLELTVRFVVADHGIRLVKDAMTREILEQLEAAKIGIASATIDITSVPTLKLEQIPSSAK